MFAISWNEALYRQYPTRQAAEAEAVRLRRWASTADRIRVVELAAIDDLIAQRLDRLAWLDGRHAA